MLARLTITACLAPMLLSAQADRWEPDIRRFEQADRENPPEKGGVVFIGSSSIRRWDLEESFPGRGYVNRGFGGSQMEDALRYADRILLPLEPRTVVLYEGDNDLAKGKSVEQVVSDYQAFVEKVHGELPEARIIFIAIKPSLARWNLIDKIRDANARIRNLTEGDPRLLYADVDGPMIGADGEPLPDIFVDDGLHLNEKGYAIWKGVLDPLLKR